MQYSNADVGIVEIYWKHVSIRTLQRFNPRWQFWNDILDIKTRYEVRFFFSVFKWSSSKSFLFPKPGNADRVDICNFTFMTFAFCLTLFPEMRPEVCCNLEWLIASNALHTVKTRRLYFTHQNTAQWNLLEYLDSHVTRFLQWRHPTYSDFWNRIGWHTVEMKSRDCQKYERFYCTLPVQCMYSECTVYVLYAKINLRRLRWCC